MEALINTVLATVLQILAMTAIPFIFFLFRKDKHISFLQYIGLYKPEKKLLLLITTATVISTAGFLIIPLIDENLKGLLSMPGTVSGNLRGQGLNFYSISILLITALFQTSFSEEILFRGFIAKRLIKKIGFKRGNIIQACIFGIVHLLLFLPGSNTIDIGQLIFIPVFPTMAGWLFGYINNKYAEGSILPGWIAHGVGNVIAFFFLAYVIR